MRSVEDKKLCYNHGPTVQQNPNALGFDFHHNSTTNCTTNNPHSHRSKGLGKLSAPSKWDDAQKWLVNLSRVGSGDRSQPRNSNADDLRLIAPVPQKEREHYLSSKEGQETDADNESVWRVNKAGSAMAVVRSVCVRDMGTEMTPIGSQEASRAATPVRATSPVARSPVSSGCTTPVREQGSCPMPSHGQIGNVNPLETRALAWDEAEKAKYMARYKREEVKIQAWENHEKRKAEMEMKKMEVKAERIKARAEEKKANKLAAARRIAEEKRANAEAKLNEKAARTSERADYIRRTGHLPSSFSFKLPSMNCW